MVASRRSRASLTGVEPCRTSPGTSSLTARRHGRTRPCVPTSSRRRTHARGRQPARPPPQTPGRPRLAALPVDEDGPAHRRAGGTYAVPYRWATNTLICDPRLFAAAGIDSPPRTWADFERDAKRLTKGNVVGTAWPMQGDPNDLTLRFLDFAVSDGTECPSAGSPIPASCCGRSRIQIWVTAPFVMLMVPAALATIPAERYEAARLDGAGGPAILRSCDPAILRSCGTSSCPPSARPRASAC
ncbi:extracellular solute-binding protein [Streptomyces sp. NPDC059092]|uniref:extracellular solute-binding protein n=1 Tax=Streptomyces sp. NPDC059092 TaxID=3346725 RepID=UPI00369A660E